MTELKVPILFMDDELNDPRADVVRLAVDALRKQGYEVTVTDKISEAIDAFYKKFFKVFILDIDMSHIDDTITEKGTMAARLYKSLDNSAAVIMFSGAGTDVDWFYLANHHVFAYVSKKARPDPISVLLKIVEKAVAAVGEEFSFPEQRDSGKVGVVLTDDPAFSPEEWQNIIAGVGKFQVEFVEIEQAVEQARKNDFSAMIVAARRFDTDPDYFSSVKAIADLSPNPHVIFACEGRMIMQDQIIDLMNCQPFRLIDLKTGNAKKDLQKAIADAANWYGAREIFVADSKDVVRLASEEDWEGFDTNMRNDSEADPVTVRANFPENREDGDEK